MDNNMLRKTINDAIIDAITVSLESQLHAVKRLKQLPVEKIARRKVGKSQVDFVEDILKNEPNGLHIKDIITRVEKKYDITLDRESIVSALTKKVTKQNRFRRTSKNTFALIKGGKE